MTAGGAVYRVELADRPAQFLVDVTFDALRQMALTHFAAACSPLHIIFYILLCLRDENDCNFYAVTCSSVEAHFVVGVLFWRLIAHRSVMWARRQKSTFCLEEFKGEGGSSASELTITG